MCPTKEFLAKRYIIPLLSMSNKAIWSCTLNGSIAKYASNKGIWFKQEFIQDKIKIQWMVMGSSTNLLLISGELISSCTLNRSSTNYLSFKAISSCTLNSFKAITSCTLNCYLFYIIKLFSFCIIIYPSKAFLAIR